MILDSEESAPGAVANFYQSSDKEAVITWVRASFVHEDIKLIVIKEFRVSIPRWHSGGIVRWLGIAPRRIRPVVPALAPALTSPLIIPISQRSVRLLLWFCCFRRPPGSFLCVFVERNLCCLKSPDQGFLTFSSPQQLIVTSLQWIQLHTSFL